MVAEVSIVTVSSGRAPIPASELKKLVPKPPVVSKIAKPKLSCPFENAVIEFVTSMNDVLPNNPPPPIVPSAEKSDSASMPSA